MDMQWLISIMNRLHGLQEKIQATAGSSSRSVLEHVRFQAPTKINDYIYEVHKPPKRPSVEIVFFHGLQLEESSFKDAHITTWLSRDKSDLWLNWLLQDFPDARILIISYDAFPWRTDDQGMTEMYIACENLLHSFTGNQAGVGQDGCPVVLVGHCLGGLVMKELCVQANSMLSLNHPNRPNEPVENFLWNVKGLFTYASPHHGSRLADSNSEFQKGALLEDLTTLNRVTERRNEAFRRLREKYGWKAFGVGETRKVTLGSFVGIVVQEASARQDVDGFCTIAEDHFNVCRHDSRTSNNFQQLSNFVVGILEEDKVRCSSTGLLDDLQVVGLEAHVEIVLEKLCGVQRLGIVGMGGIGKSTLAKATFDKISRNFEYACFLDDVKNRVVAKESPSYLREKIKGKLMQRGRNVNSSYDWSNLKGKRVLIILDDAEFESQVMVMNESDGFSRESRVIVTSRDCGFLRPQDFEIYTVGQLGLDDSKRLFCLHAFKQPRVPVAYEEYEERVTRFVEKCGGLPLALKVSGRYLYNKKNEAAWDDGLEKLSRAQPLNGSLNDGLWSILRVSYESLATSEQEMFLDVATCFHGEDFPKVHEAWRVCSWASADSGLQNLKDRSLVSVTCDPFDYHEYISMHEVLRDMGRSIAGHTRVVGTPAEFIRLSKPEKATLKVLKLHGAYGGTLLNAGFFAGLKELQILWLQNIYVHPDRPRGHLLPKLVFFSSNRELGTAMYPSLKHRLCAGLRIIDMPISQSQSLRSVILEGQTMTHLPSSWCLLSQLERLEIVCCSLATLPGNFGQLQGLRYLSILGCWKLKRLPDSFARLSQLERLEIDRCHSLATFPRNFGQLPGLRYLSVRDCTSLRGLPDSFARLSSLEKLEFEGCRSLTISLLCLFDLRALQHLHIAQCNRIMGGWYELKVEDERSWKLSEFHSLSIRELNSMGALRKEKEMFTQKNTNLVGAIEDVEVGVLVAEGGLPTYKLSSEKENKNEYELSYCGSLAKLPESIAQPQRLQCLKIRRWRGEVLGLQNSRELQHLVISDSDLLELPKSIKQLSTLRHLEIDRWKCLKAFPNLLGRIEALKQLKISNCPLLTKLETVGNLQALQQLKIISCESLVALPTTLGQLQALKELRSMTVKK